VEKLRKNTVKIRVEGLKNALLFWRVLFSERTSEKKKLQHRKKDVSDQRTEIIACNGGQKSLQINIENKETKKKVRCWATLQSSDMPDAIQDCHTRRRVWLTAASPVGMTVILYNPATNAAKRPGMAASCRASGLKIFEYIKRSAPNLPPKGRRLRELYGGNRWVQIRRQLSTSLAHFARRRFCCQQPASHRRRTEDLMTKKPDEAGGTVVLDSFRRHNFPDCILVVILPDCLGPAYSLYR